MQYFAKYKRFRYGILFSICHKKERKQKKRKGLKSQKRLYGKL